jgi:hypothetical protein
MNVHSCDKGSLSSFARLFDYKLSCQHCNNAVGFLLSMSVPHYCPCLHLTNTSQIFWTLKWKKINWNSVPKLKIYDPSRSTYKSKFHIKVISSTYFVSLLVYCIARLRFPSSDHHVMLWVRWFVTILKKYSSFWFQGKIHNSRHSHHIYSTQPYSILYSDWQLQKYIQANVKACWKYPFQ